MAIAITILFLLVAGGILGSAINFGSIFLGFQIYEFSHFVSDAGLTLKQNLFGSTFFVLTGTHGCHVAIGVLWLSALFVSGLWLGRPQSPTAADRDADKVRPRLPRP